ncbi:zinc finger protein MYND domain-containing protein, putative [Pediculus humanus corporis]|uniref:Zinc finger protein MYND domain-containing protein, putative n=1 Tax=Pediculus humanus subsp. corporis TaxID=121224 RepID=E0VHA0_PEDHC|nr:zinc finger protein MYND domain-containing protein, putative [Pediculus humanus corporis]EEB12756.1 zinc finger protein MYND domain-containing protein, putative [Pediculus humanus corporis]
MSEIILNDILQPGEIELYVQNLLPSNVEDLGTPKWFESHHFLQKLHQQSCVEAREMREEVVKDLLISHCKLPILIHEVVCIQVWREKILSQILKLNYEPQVTLIIYITLFHEVTAVGLLENVLYHRDSVSCINDEITDLIDYCASEIVRLISEARFFSMKDDTKSSYTSNKEEIKCQYKTISFNVELSTLNILRYLAEFVEEIPLSASSRMYKTHDVPLLMVNLIQMSPWKRVNSKINTVQIFEDRVWKNIDKISGISKYEGQCWIALRFLLLNPQSQYEINDFRKQHFLKAQPLIDQIPPLLDLKQFLTNLSFQNVLINDKKPLIMETIPEIKSNILKKCFKKWKKITKKQVELMFFPKKETLMEIGKRLGETYDVDHLEKVFPEGPVCSNCGDAACKRCSGCKNEWYCGRECQVKRWSKHKMVCSIMSSKNEK